MSERDIIEKLMATLDRVCKWKKESGEFFYCYCCGKGPLVFVNLDYRGNVSCDECVGFLKGEIILKRNSKKV